jgi:hypothetical protein
LVRIKRRFRHRVSPEKGKLPESLVHHGTRSCFLSQGISPEVSRQQKDSSW